MANIDFEDEEAVLAEVAREIDIDPDDLKIDDSGRGFSSFGAGTVYLITIRDGKHGKEWCVVENDEQEEELALAVVKQDLEEEPQNFNQDFIESHIDTNQLRRDLESDVQNMAEEELRDMRDREFWRTAERYIDIPEEDEDGEMPDKDDYIDDVAEKMTEERLKDPMSYLEDIYGREDAVKQAIEIAGIDIDAAAQEAVDTDGAAHFLSSYDGNSYTTKNGLVYWRAN